VQQSRNLCVNYSKEMINGHARVKAFGEGSKVSQTERTLCSDKQA
jgi:hypothetical protein